MKCEYCGKELPKIINGRMDICSCKYANESWRINMRIENLKKQLQYANKELSDLKKQIK